ncbi:hypothetical protein AX15_007533 [Amanita polypyramis BW_CC]|nr:hypothetical protein AX15_007533 [Amanita polypyramis BW_CC]
MSGNTPQASSYPLLSRKLRRREKSESRNGNERDRKTGRTTPRNFSVPSWWSQGGHGEGFSVIDRSPSQTLEELIGVPGLVTFTFGPSAAGSNPLPSNDSNISASSNSDNSNCQAQHANSSPDIASKFPPVPGPNSVLFPSSVGTSSTATDSTTSTSLQRSISEAADDIRAEILTQPSCSGSSESNASLTESNYTQHKFNPFLSSSMSPPSNDDPVDNKSTPKVGTDTLGYALLPTSEFILDLESDCEFHYEFWDAFNETQFWFPIDLALHLDPSRAQRYDSYGILALPIVPKIAVRITSVAVPTRFSRLAPKPPSHTAQQSTGIPFNQIYTTYYRGRILNSPRQAPKPDKTETITHQQSIHLPKDWERIIPANNYKRGRSTSASTSGTGSSLPEPDAEAKRTEILAADKRGFILRAWIPVPPRLFETKETCTFRVDARVWVEEPYVRVENSRSLIPKPRRYKQEMGRGTPRCQWEVGDFSDDVSSRNPDYRILEASRTVTVSHLQRDREML